MMKSYLKKNKVTKSYKSFQMSCYGVDPETGDPIDPKTTRASSKNDAASKLHVTAFRLGDGASLLDGVVNTLRDANSSKKSRKEAAKLIQASIIPLMGKAADVTHDAANVVSPIAGSGYVGRREDNNRAREISYGSPRSTPALMLVKDFVGTSDAEKSSPPRRKPSQRRANLKLSLPPPPSPENGDTYGIGEFLMHVMRFSKGTPARGSFIARVMAPPYSYVQKGQATIRRHIRRAEAGERFRFDQSWNYVGRQPLMTVSEIDKYAQEFASG
jgi:hypothetical protein